MADERPDTRESLALELAEERNETERELYETCGSEPWGQTEMDYLPEALAFVDRCIAVAGSVKNGERT